VHAADEQDQPLVISVVYDGAPSAGKTTSVRALARSFGREAWTPEEQAGRTVFFDWLEYTGGRYDGAPIRCEIASVPGQRHWAQRRGWFLERADVVVFVGDTTADAWPETVTRLRELCRQLGARPGAPVGVVFQANKRDHPDAVPLAAVRACVAGERIAVVESSATDGTGVREAFVFAVRLALDRLRAGSPEMQTPRGAARDSREVLAIVRGLDRAPEAPPAVTAGTAPRSPGGDVAPGFVWPPIDGRIVLHEAAVELADAVRQDGAGDWRVGAGAVWIAQSPAGAVFADLEQGRSALVAWARLHAGAGRLLSRRRCIALAETGDGRWRLWQIVLREPTLRDLYEAAGPAVDAGDAVRRLATVVRVLAAAAATGATLPCTVDSIGVTDGGAPLHVGLLAPPDIAAVGSPLPERLAGELASLVRGHSLPEQVALREAVATGAALGLVDGVAVGPLLHTLLAS
jgi:signal recognition particle receptor subunit beta